jgi:hypothetical protein
MNCAVLGLFTMSFPGAGVIVIELGCVVIGQI